MLRAAHAVRALVAAATDPVIRSAALPALSVLSASRSASATVVTVELREAGEQRGEWNESSLGES